MSRNLFSEKLAASTRKAKEMIPEVKPKSASLPEVTYQNDLLNPADLELLWKNRYPERVWPD